jgi:hypothetical protein
MRERERLKQTPKQKESFLHWKEQRAKHTVCVDGRRTLTVEADEAVESHSQPGMSGMTR